jgi:hypothetical protein
MPIKLDPGWRLLKVGDTICDSDMYDAFGEGVWKPVSVGCKSLIGTKHNRNQVAFSTWAVTPKGNYITSDL